MLKDSRLVGAGNPVLLQTAVEIEPSEYDTEDLRALAKELFDVSSKVDAHGVAAPQIGVGKKVFVMTPRLRKNINLTAEDQAPSIFINPTFTAIDETQEEFWEGCLSIGNIYAMVPRYKKIKVKFNDQYGNEHEKIYADFVARIMQHEIDHLNGILFFERVKNLRSYLHISEYEKCIISANIK